MIIKKSETFPHKSNLHSWVGGGTEGRCWMRCWMRSQLALTCRLKSLCKFIYLLHGDYKISSITISRIVGIEANVQINSYKIKPLFFELSNAVFYFSFELFEFFERAALLLLQIFQRIKQKEETSCSCRYVLEEEYGISERGA